MSYRFNPFTGTFDEVGASSGGGGSSFDPDTILTGPTECLYAGPTVPIEVLLDNNGNVLVGP